MPGSRWRLQFRGKAGALELLYKPVAVTRSQEDVVHQLVSGQRRIPLRDGPVSLQMLIEVQPVDNPSSAVVGRGDERINPIGEV